MAKRNQSVEVYRCCLMFGICLLHAVGFSGYEHKWLANVLCPCVNAFVFISGWYGCRFNLKKVLRLLGVGLFCAVSMTLCLEFSGFADRSYGDWIHQFFRMYKNYWFLHAYIVLLFVAPVINPLFECKCDKLTDRRVLNVVIPFLLLAFGWSFLSTLKVCQSWLPIPSGLGSYTPLTLVGVYVAARYCRWSGLLDHIPIWASFSRCFHDWIRTLFVAFCCRSGSIIIFAVHGA